MNKPRKIQRIQERYFSAHHMLLSNAKHELALAQTKGIGWRDQAFVSLTLSALAIEAMANAFGKKVIPEWEIFESACPLAKVCLISDRLGLSYDFQVSPWREVKWLSQFRNEVAHPKAESVVEEQMIDENKHDDRKFEPPLSKLERKVSVHQAKHSVAAIDSLQHMFCQQLPPEDRFGLSSDAWTGTSRLLPASPTQ